VRVFTVLLHKAWTTRGLGDHRRGLDLFLLLSLFPDYRFVEIVRVPGLIGLPLCSGITYRTLTAGSGKPNLSLQMFALNGVDSARAS
jgi:hypothetical protein